VLTLLAAALWARTTLGNQAALEYLRRLAPQVQATVRPQGKDAGGSPANLVNGSGIGSDELCDDSYSGWHSDGTDPARQWVKLDLGGLFPVERLKVWNYNFTWTRPDGKRQSFAHRGVRDARIYYSTQDDDPGDDLGADGWTLLKSVRFTMARSFQRNGPDVVELGRISVRRLAVDIRSAHSGDGARRFVGLNEVRVEPEPVVQEAPQPQPVPPVVQNAGARDLATVGARLAGVLTSGNRARVTAEWWRNGDEAVRQSVTDDILRNGSFAINANLLQPDTTYHFRFRAANAAGTAWSKERTFITPTKMVAMPISGDVEIDRDTTYVNTHLKILGNLRVRRGTLTLNGCVVEFMSRYSREFGIEWRGGTVVTNYTTIGGTQRDGVNCQGRFDLKDGVWIASDTIVRYTYGITCGPARPVLYATRLIQGPNPDSIIPGRSNARVVLKDSSYNISLYTDSSRGADGRLDLPHRSRFSRVFDRNNVPGARYRIEVIDSTVPTWWVFFGGIEPGRPESEIVLDDCPFFIPSINARNLKGELRLPAPWPAPGETRATLKIGNLTLRTSEEPVGTRAWGIYLSGAETDVTVAGRTHCCEFMMWDGKARFVGTPGTRDSIQACTTVDLHGAAQASFRNVTLSTRGPADPILPQITVDGRAQLIAEGCQIGKLRLFARGRGRMQFTNCTSRLPGFPLIAEGAERITMRSAPIIESVPAPCAVVGKPYRYAISARLPPVADRDDRTIRYVAATMPHWLRFNPTAGVLTGVPSTGAVGAHRVGLQASAQGLSREQRFDIIVRERALSPTALPAVPGLLVHLEASLAGQTGDGAAVPGWYDLSGNGNHARAAMGQPTYRDDAYNGRAAVHFPGNTSMTCGTVRAAVGGVTIFVVSQCRENSSPDKWPRLVAARADDGVPWRTPGFQLMAPFHPSTKTGVLYDLRVDTFVHAAKTLANLGIGNGGITPQYFAGDLFAVLVYGRSVTQPERARIEEHLRRKYSVPQ